MPHPQEVLAAGATMEIPDSDSPAAMLACQSVLRMLHNRSKAFPEANCPAQNNAEVHPQRKAAAGCVSSWEQQLLEEVRASALPTPMSCLCKTLATSLHGKGNTICLRFHM